MLLGSLVVFAGACVAAALADISGDLTSLWRIPAALSSLVVVVALGGLLARYVRGTALARLSYASFGAYLIHRPMYGALLDVFHPSYMWSALALFMVGVTVLAFGLGYGAARSVGQPAPA